ncbi:ATP-dependent exoDNAse (exonuclease V) beta subunit (contains helicase and exonuclease domains) [Bradyrhizobium lablabi]|uniref:DNA 3'-5' helicase n=1 Tax=Bradyrhizobium lablabi TaxID=722472 RepID=A0A1M7A434_9BRAD|nr:UvrD-helicase domain-containing protein [Bradyrhizobium lablabi]SHL37484.1 ATP-dependent exoDNAse (exonuclease V) beta subunit (contains helicase and exonuclease domains) [Bradyrhizobium lablabi]
MNELGDGEARRRILTEFGFTFFVEAAAGTGKTSALVGRIVSLVRTGTGRLEQVVAVTFTEKAAGEMKLRLRSEIEKARAQATSIERNRLDQALRELELARIGTIHGFCGDILHERPIEAGIDALFAVASEDEAEAIADQAFDRWFEKILEEPPEGIRRVLRRRARGQRPRDQLRTAFHTLRGHRDFPARWRRDPFDRDRAIDALIEELRNVGALATSSSWTDDYLTRSLTEIARFAGESTRLEAVRGRDYDGLEASLRSFTRQRSWSWKGWAGTKFGMFSRDDVLSRRDRLKANLASFIAASDADLAPILHEVLQDPIADYERLKAKAGRLDFLDLLIKTRDLVRNDALVRGELQRRYTHFFVDEFQDTDPLQSEILLLLASEDPKEANWRAAYPIPGKLFLVGDPKQSVYRFRRADVSFYEDVKSQLLAQGAVLLHLTTSFRAPPSIQDFVNGAFAPAMAAGQAGGQATYVPLGHSRLEIAGQPTLIALPVPRPYGEYGNITNRSIEESFPDAVGGFIDWLINESGWKIEEEGAQVPIKPRHIAILSRRFRNFGADVTRPYVRALESRRIPHVLMGGRSFHDREEVIALRTAIEAIEWPDDELKIYATLRGPFFAFSDEALLAFRQYVDADGVVKRRHLNPLRSIDQSILDSAGGQVADALALLRRLHAGRNYRPIAETIGMLLEAVRAHAGIALWPTGEQALGNCQRMIDMAQHFEQRAFSFRSFVEKLETDAERGEVDEAPIVEEGTEGVRIMTVHKAKGLEFPVVILADPTCTATRDTPSRHVNPARHLWLESICGSTPVELLEAAAEELQRDEAEATRLAYVAATRARDLLVMPVTGDQPFGGWLNVLNPALYPEKNGRRIAELAPGCPEFGEDSVLERGPKGRAPPEGPVRPGLHRPITGGPAIVWWDPTKITLDVDELTSLRHQRLLEPSSDGSTVSKSEEDYAAWKNAREKLQQVSSQPSISVQTVTSLVRARSFEESPDQGTGDATRSYPSVEIEVLDRGAFERPGGRRFGVLVHALLSSVEFDAGIDAIRSAATIAGRIVNATEDEVKAASAVVQDALEHPILRRAAASGGRGKLRRETPVLQKRKNGTLIEGVIDLAFQEEESTFAGWTVLDFKTDREFDRSSERYVDQVRMYAEAVAAATATSVRGFVLVV